MEILNLQNKKKEGKTFVRIDYKVAGLGSRSCGPRLADKYKVRIPSFGHAGDGNLHVYVCRDKLNDTDWKNTLNLCFDEMYSKAEELGGLVSGEHGIGYAKKDYLKRQYGERPIELMQGIKKVFDPKNILNPDKVCF